MNVEIREFKKDDYQPYKAWFANKALMDALGRVDTEWLDHILTQTDGIELAACLNDQLVGVIGIVFPTTENPIAGITNIAVDPKLTGQGIGTAVLDEVVAMFNSGSQQDWTCFVDYKNRQARSFFANNNWVNVGEIEAGLLEFRKTKG